MVAKTKKNVDADEVELHITWPTYIPGKSSLSDILRIVGLINDKFRERLPAWPIIVKQQQYFPNFFNEVLHAALDEGMPFARQTEIVTFLANCFNSLEVELVCQEAGKLCSMPIWINLLPSQLNHLLEQNQKMKKIWTKMGQKFEKLPDDEFKKTDFNRRFLWRLLQRLKRTVDFIDDESKTLDIEAVSYCERLISFFIDLEAQLTTRRFFNAILHSSHAIIHCLLSQFILAEHGSLFCDLVGMLRFYARFEIDDVSGQQLTAAEVVKRHYNSISQLQKAVFKFLRDKMAEFCLLPVASVDTSKFLHEQLDLLSVDQLRQIAEYLRLVPTQDSNQQNVPNEGLDINFTRLDDRTFLREAITYQCERQPSQLQKLNAEPLYPMELVLWDEKLVPYEHYDGKSVLPLNKLNLQFLTLHDYLLRNFNLFRMESIYEIRQDIEDALFRMKPWCHEHNEEIVWGGWAKMALPVGGCRIVQVGKPLVGESAPSEVRADIQLSLPSRSDLREEWTSIRKNDALFLLKINPIRPVGHKFDVRQPFKTQFDVIYVRGCEVEGIIGPEGRVLDEMESRDAVRKMPGDVRNFRVRFDPNQYKDDTAKGIETDVYFTFNLVVRRDPKTNNFKAVLATIRQLLNTECVVPDWLHDLILGYGEPDTAHYSRMHNTVPHVDFNDTFLSFEHLKKSFPERNIVCEEQNPTPPFRLTMKEFVPQHDVDFDKRDTSILVESQRGFRRIVAEAFHTNTIEFTPSQVEAIKSGMQPGLTLVVGPPGTGKTDVAVQIISNIYHNWPEQRTLIVTHSNQALNQLFEKIIRLDVDERHLLRMGHGEEALETEKDFSRYGRVNYVLEERQRLLEQVDLLRTAIDEAGDVAYSCETAGYFFRYTICKTWEYFTEQVEKARKDAEEQKTLTPSAFISEHFPFAKFFEKRHHQSNCLPLKFKCKNFSEDFSVALDGWERVKDVFKKLEEFRAFELLRNGRDRANYLLVKEAKIIAMTCTHAALRRRELVELGFRYDNILMEEAAQILEVETFVPLLLQDPQDGRSRLKRWIMIGDHHQLPPVVQNVAYQKFSNMEQSLFARLIRLGVPSVELDAQGRARPELAALYNWRYTKLGDLPHVLTQPEFRGRNPGFLHNFQFIDILDFNGVGESTPSSYFYQNLGEAEYAVAIFVYMRILGYPANKISIITTYNGQAALLRDVVHRRCAENPFIGVPAKISTVDRYQGQQNEYIILSLVRTKTVGHLRDVRRLIVALSRARLGLYVLGRLSLFKRCYELSSAFERLLRRPTQLILLPNEQYSTETTFESPTMAPMKIADTTHMSQFVAEFYKSNLEFIKERHLAEMGMEEEEMPEQEQNVPQNKSAALPSTSTEQIGDGQQASSADEPPSQTDSTTKEKAEGSIVFEQVDFERLQEVPKYD